MPFIPLPKTFLDCLAHKSEHNSCIVELGCGDGRFGKLLASQGVLSIGLDRVHPDAGSAATIVGDANNPPFLPGSIDLLIAGNLARHLLSDDKQAYFLKKWMTLLAPDGHLFVFEDEPSKETPAMINYVRFQKFLATVAWGQREPLLSLKKFRKLTHNTSFNSSWQFGLERNTCTADVNTVLNLLGGSELLTPEGETGRLVESVANYGLDYGYYWWACHRGN